MSLPDEFAVDKADPSPAAYGWSLNGRSWTLTRRADGVPVLDGSTDCPSVGLLVWMVSMSIAVALPPVAIWLLRADFLSLTFVVLCCGTLSMLMLVSARRVVSIRRRLRALESSNELSARLGLDPAAFPTLSHVNRIPVRFIVNGQAYYRPQDFASIASLLRPAIPPYSDSLPRVPANPNTDKSDGLVRPIDGGNRRDSDVV